MIKENVVYHSPNGSKGWHPWTRWFGGSGGGNDAPNTLKADAKATFIDLLSEGEVEGLLNGGQSIFFNNTPLQNSDGSYNFSGASYNFLSGTPDQTYLPGINNTSTPISVQAAVVHATPIIRSITDTDINSVYVVLQVDSLSSTDKKGNVNGTSVDLQIFINDVLKVDFNCNGKCESPYQKGFYIDLTGETFPIELKVVRTTDDSSSDDLQNGTTFYGYNEIINQKFSYPNSAVMGISLDAAQFGGEAPARGYLGKWLKIKIPSNYDPIARTYDGIWDGTFTTAWSNNPIWVFYDVVTNQRYGLGTVLPAGILDKFSAYTAAQYCDGLVPDGKGGTEPRYTFNGVILQANDVPTALQQIASNFMGFSYFINGAISFGVDMPKDPVAIYTPANVLQGQFSYQTTPYSQRVSVANVTWNDPNNNYEQTVETYSDASLFEKLGQTSININGVGITSQGQAHRLAKWAVYTSSYQTETITFGVGLEGLVRLPGNVILVSDPTIAGKRSGGRIALLSGTTCTIDSPFTIASGEEYSIQITQNDGTLFETGITNSPGTYTVLTLSSAAPVGADKGSIYTIPETDLQPTQWMITTVQSNDDGTYTINAVSYDPSKYAYIENNVNLQPTNGSLYPKFLTSTVKNIRTSINPYVLNTQTMYQIFTSWDSLPGAFIYEYQWSYNNGNYSDLVRTSTTSFEIDGQPGLYTFQIRAYDVSNRVTQFNSYSITVNNSFLPIPDVTNFTSARQSQDVIFSWDPVNSSILQNYEIRKGTSWSTAHVVATPSTTSCTVSEPDESTFLIKAYSYYGAYSVNSAETTCLPVTNQYVEFDQEEKDESWPGTLVNMFINGSGNLESDDVDTCSYTTEAIDFGEVLTARLAITTTINADRDMSLDDFWTLYPTLGAIPGTTTLGGDPNAVSATFSISTSNDGSTWTPFVSYFPGFKKYRYIKVKITFTRSDGSVVPELSSMYMKWDLLAVSQQKNGFSVADTGTTFVFSSVSNPVVYSREAAVVAAVQNGDPGDTVHVVSNLTQATFTIYDATLTAKPGTINFSITGF